MENEMPGSARNILRRYLEELRTEELKTFTFLLEGYPVGKGYSKIRRGQLENPDSLKIAGLMINQYQDEHALEIAGNLLYQIPRMDLCEKFKCDSQKHMAKNPKLQRTRVTHSNEYMDYIKEKFTTLKENNSHIGGDIHLKEIYTKLLIVKEHRPQAEREHEIMSTGKRHLELMAQRDGRSYSSVAALFDPDEYGHVPRTVVLQGAAGIGKTMTSRKIMLDWASRELFQGKFHYMFYINCREMNQLSGQQTIAELLLHSCPGMSLPMSEIEAEPGKVLFIIDGFDELSNSIDLMTSDPSRETLKDNTMMGLIRRRFLLQSYIIVTTRPTALEKLHKCLEAPRFAEILGFSEDDRKEYFTRYFKNKTKATDAFKIVKGNDILFTMCFVPIVCWIVCTVIKLWMEKKEDRVQALRTTTSVYMSFLSSLLKQQSSDSVQPIHMNLKRLCALARDGVWEQKILFKEEDITNHDLEIPAVQSLFLTNDMFQKVTECENCYSFIHLSFQEFFAAMFYVLRENEETAEHTENPGRAVTSLLEASRTQKHLMLTVHFLFGLLSKETQNDMEKIFTLKIKSDIKPALLQWIKGEMKQDFSSVNNEQMGLFHCLYEIEDEKFVKSATEHVKQIGVSKHSLGREINVMDSRTLGFCLKNSPGVERVIIRDIDMKPEDVQALTPGLMTCSCLRMDLCSLTASCCADLASVLRTNPSLTELDLGYNELMDSGVIALCEGLRHPGCRIQRLLMRDCSLTASCCEALASVFSENSSLTELGLNNNKLMDSGVRKLCKGLKHPGCNIQRLVIERCSLTASCCVALSSVLTTNSSLTQLDLSRNNLMDSGVIALCAGLKHPGCRIQTLGLEGCSLTASCCAALSSVLTTNSSLTELNVSWNKLMDSGVIALCAGLKHPGCKIQRLGLGHCSLTASCCADLASVLGINSSLTELDLSWNELMDSGVIALCAGLGNPGCTIQRLGLRSTELTGSCTEALCAALCTNSTLRHLDLVMNPFTETSGLRLQELQQTGRILELQYSINKYCPTDVESSFLCSMFCTSYITPEKWLSWMMHQLWNLLRSLGLRFYPWQGWLSLPRSIK